MALKTSEVELIADKIVTNLISNKMVMLNKDFSMLRSVIIEVLLNDIEKERKIDKLTKEVLGQFSKEIENQNVDSVKLFTMAKRKIAKQEEFLL